MWGVQRLKLNNFCQTNSSLFHPSFPCIGSGLYPDSSASLMKVIRQRHLVKKNKNSIPLFLTSLTRNIKQNTAVGTFKTKKRTPRFHKYLLVSQEAPWDANTSPQMTTEEFHPTKSCHQHVLCQPLVCWHFGSKRKRNNGYFHYGRKRYRQISRERCVWQQSAVSQTPTPGRGP